MIHLQALQHAAEQAWRNGGGSTRELLAWPQADRWDLRLSVARIDCNGPFSAFPGVQRWFAVLQGAGVRLRWPGGEQQLRPGDAPTAFDGGDPPACSLIDGATLDLNLMLRNDAGQGRLRPVVAGAPCPGSGRWRGVYSHTPATLQAGSNTQALPAGTLAWSDTAGTVPWRLQPAGPVLQAWWIDFVAHPR